MREYTYDSIKYTIHSDVYKPAEDTFLLARILEKGQILGTTLEVGTGCGLLSLISAKKRSNVIATDINPHAVTTTQLNARNNALDARIEVVRCDIAAGLSKNRTFDHIIFNPPYLPIEEKGGDWLPRSWAGGASGIEFAENVITETTSMLRPKGDYTFIVSGEDSLQQITSIAEKRSMRLRVIDSTSFFFERIFAVSATLTA